MFRIEEMEAQSPTFRKVMDDEIATDEEVAQQSALVLNLYRELETEFTEAQLARIADVIVQTGVLQSVMQLKELQEFHR